MNRKNRKGQVMAESKLFYGDNFDVLKRYIKDESVDLVYLDPPFNSQATYNVLFAERDGSKSEEQIKAFEDTWQWGPIAARSLKEFQVAGPPNASMAMQAFEKFLGGSNLLAYLAMMAPRLVELRRVMKPTATLYLHCDPTASHYLKVLMDAIFGARNYRNEIVWCYAGGGIPKKDFPRKHDIIFRYTKTDIYKFNPVYKPYSPGTIKRGRTAVKGIYAEIGLREEGTPVNDWWADVPKITSPTDPEKLGYPTQKSKALLRRILQSSVDRGDLILDPFCGCGTAVDVAQELGVNWIGIDITHLAISLIKNRLINTYGAGIADSYEVIGEPTGLAGAVALAKQDRYQFQFWALSLVKARPAASDEKKGADKGIDGRLFFHDEPDGRQTKQIIFSVKSGKLTASMLRDLRGVVEREGAAIGVLITLEEPTRQMVSEAASAGFYDSPWHSSHLKLQILTIAGLIAGTEKLDMPQTPDLRTYKRAAKVKGKRERPDNLSETIREATPLLDVDT